MLNPTGRVWLMVAGGGASVIYADTVGDLGYAQVRCACSKHTNEITRRVCGPSLPCFLCGVFQAVWWRINSPQLAPPRTAPPHRVARASPGVTRRHPPPGHQELGNYGEYSGAPNTNETYQYARTVIQTATCERRA